MTIDRHHAIGEATVTRVAEITAALPAATLFPGWAGQEAASHTLEISVHSWLVRHRDRVILVDTGVGNGKARGSAMFNDLHTPFLDRLAAAGVVPAEVTDVLLTHLHTDHVGWNTVEHDGRWVPTFPNARTVLPRAGYDWFATGPGRDAPNRDMFLDSVVPVVEAGNVLFVPPEGGEVLDGWSYHPTPGHSVDHMSIILQSAGARAMFAGDVMHHPVQVAHPELSSMFCADPARGRLSREWALNEAAKDGMPWFSSHNCAPSAGRVDLAEGGGYRWVSA